VLSNGVDITTTKERGGRKEKGKNEKIVP